MTRHIQRFRYLSAEARSAIVVSVQEPFQSAHELASSALELARLARGLGMLVVRTVVQERVHAAASTLLSEGRLRQLAELTGGPGTCKLQPELAELSQVRDSRELVDVVLFDCALSASQQRSLERALDAEVLDRTAVILRIFELRARTHEARLQVSLARRLYDAPRVRDDHSLGDKEGGGGRGARGHSNVQLKKQRNRRETAALRKELESMGARATAQRERRAETPQVALVGYTNAGKSSLMRALTKSEVMVADEPFATVSLTVRALTPATVPRILVADTVGFIAKLPHELVASFRATLDEARQASLLLVVVDAADPDFREQLYVTQRTLEEIGASHVPYRVVFNKVDRLSPQRRESLALEYPDGLLISAHVEADIARLHARLAQYFERGLSSARLIVPFNRGDLLSEMHARARILEQRSTSRGTVVRLRALPESLRHWREALTADARSHPCATKAQLG